MKAVIQRVKKAAVSVEEKIVGSVDNGLLILLGVAKEDTEAEALQLATKISKMRVFTDSEDKMNLSLLDIGGEALVISNFTLLADVRRGNRPSFDPAMPPKEADRLYNYFCEKLCECGVKRVERGVFGADMEVSLINDGPVTISVDTEDFKKPRK